MVVTNDFINYPALRTLPALSFIAPASFLRMDAKGSAASPGNAGELPFKIDGMAGWLALIAAIQVAGPFFLIAAGEEEITSSLAGILVASRSAAAGPV